MPVQIASLNSGSNANCYYVGTPAGGVLVDAGLSCRETEKRLLRLGLQPAHIKAVFLSHEHADHIAGLEHLCKKFRWPVYGSPATLKHAGVRVDQQLMNHISANQRIPIAEMEVVAFSKQHDAADPMSFVVACGGLKVGIITDIGYACSNTVHHFAACDAVFLESNYCEEMLLNGSYPYHLKQRIHGNNGHLSNKQALELFCNYRSQRLQVLILSHLSQHNNRPELVSALFAPHAGRTAVMVASRLKESNLITLAAPAAGNSRKFKKPLPQQQLSLFEQQEH